MEGISLKISNLLKQHNILTSFSCKNNLKSIFVHNKDKLNTLDKAGVYKLNCNDCDAYYIGKSERNFKVRIDEHLDNSHNYLLKDHLNEFNHRFDINTGFKPLHIESNNFKIELLEQIEINIHKKHDRANILNKKLLSHKSKLLDIFS